MDLLYAFEFYENKSFPLPSMQYWTYTAAVALI